MSSPSSFKVLLPYMDNAAQLMAQITSPHVHRFAHIAHKPYVDDKTIECDDLDDQANIVLVYADSIQYHPRHL